MIGLINRTRRAHIVTIEDPIEVIHTDDLSVIWQREIGPDTGSFAIALRQVLRQDPDAIFLGEIRDPDSALAAVRAAQTGHLAARSRGPKHGRPGEGVRPWSSRRDGWLRPTNRVIGWRTARPRCPSP